MRYSADAPAAVLSPHLDDAVLSAWSVVRRPGDVRVVNVCTAVPPPGPPPEWDRRTGATDAAERMHERLAEDREALAIAGREAVALGFLDAQYRTGPIDPSDLSAALVEAVPHAAELWAPAGIGGHADHLQVREAALAIASAGGPPVRLYAELPYAVRHGWPSWVAGRGEHDGLDQDGRWSDSLPGGRSLPAARHELAPEEAELKLRALAAYRTQWSALDRSDARVSRPETIRYEVSFDAAGVAAGQ